MSWARLGDRWVHRPWWKVAINTILRRLQPRHPSPVVVYSVCREGDPPIVMRYGIGRVRHTDRQHAGARAAPVR